MQKDCITMRVGMLQFKEPTVKVVKVVKQYAFSTIWHISLAMFCFLLCLIKQRNTFNITKLIVIASTDKFRMAFVIFNFVCFFFLLSDLSQNIVIEVSC